jgi:hypothetical protein
LPVSYTRLGNEEIGLVPFWDLANHSVEPNTDFRVGKSLELVAVKDLEADKEILISYTGNRNNSLSNENLISRQIQQQYIL